MTDDEIHHVSLSWKFNERRHFPKLTSRVGDDYQASSLPSAGTEGNSKGDSDVHCFDQVFDPTKATEGGSVGLCSERDEHSHPIEGGCNGHSAPTGLQDGWIR